MEKITLRGFLICFLFNLLLSQNIFSQCPSIPNTTQYFCDSQDPTIASLTAVDTGDGVQWYATASSTIPLNSDTALIDGMTYFADNNTGTCGARESVEVIIYGEPQGVSYQGFCITSSSQVLPTIADLFAVGENLIWYDAETGGNVLSESTTLTDGQLYYVSQTPSGTGCETTRFSVLVSLFLVTEAPVGDSEQYFCGSSSNPPTVADILASGTNNWYSSLTASTPLNNATPLIDGATYYGTEVNAPCESDNRLAVTVTVYDENIAGDDTTLELCESDLANIGTIDLFSELNGNPDSNGVWTGDLPVSGNIVDATSMSGNNTYSFTYTVQNSTSCPEDSAIVTIVVSPTINSGENGVASFCISDAGEDLINYLGGSPDTGGTWSPALASGTGFFDPSQDSSGTYTYTVLGSGGCDASSATVDVTVFNLPQAGVFTGVQDVCANNSSFDLYSLLDGSEDSNGTWLDNSNATITNPIDASSLTLGAHSFTYEVSNFCGVTSTAVTINVIQGPSSGTFTGIVDFCNPSTNLDLFTLLDGSQDSGGIWTNQSGVSVSESIDLSTLSVGTYSYTYTVTSTACDSVATEVTFTISSTDSSGVFTGSQDVCSTTSAFDLFSLLDGSESVNGTWLDSSNNTITNPIDVNTLALGTQTYTYQVNNSCGSSSTTVNFEVLEGFSSGIALNDVSYCANEGTLDLFDLLANEDTGGIWTDASNNTVASEIDITSLTAGTYNYTYTVSSASCGDNASTVTFEISEELSSGVFTGIQNVCPSDVTFDLFNLLDGSESTNGQWTDELGTVVSNPIEVTTFSEGTYTYTYTVSNTCGSSSTEVSFLIPSNFDPGTNGSVTFCSDDSGADLFDYLGGTPEEGGIWSPSLASGTGFFDPSVDAPGTYFYSSPLVSGGCFQTSSLVEVTVEQSLSSGDFVGLTTYCASEGTLDLFDLLANEDTGGIWTDASNNTVASEIDITSFTAGTYNYTYTVSSASCGDNATTVTFEISEELSSGVFTGIQNVCPSDVTFDLYTLLDGTQDEGGVWTNSNNDIISSVIAPADYNTGTNTFTYTVSGSCVSDSETVQIEILESIDMDAVTLSVDTEICYGTQALVALQNIPEGVYTITYSLSGSNTVGDQTANIAVNAGTGSFVVDESLLSNVGVTTISVTEILPQETNSCNISSSIITASFEVVEGPSIATSALSIDNVCLGNEGTLTITNTNLSDGDYQLTYSLETTSGSNSYTSETISFANGDAVFNIPVDQISLTDAYLLTITSVVNLDTGCANLNTDAFITFEVTDVPDIDVDQTKLFTQNVCLGVANDVIISNPSIPDGDYIIEYEVSGVVNYSESDLIVTLIDGEAVFTIPGEVLATEGTVSVLLVNLSDGAVECPIYFTDIASATFEIYNGDMIEMEEEGNIFCEQDMPTFESLTENLINPDGEVAWYDAAVGGNMYENTDMLEPGVTYYGVYADYADCPNTERLAVTVEITYCDVIIPDGFSPNNDGVNETFTIHNLREYYPNFEIEIFNRYGNVVYKGNFDTPDWDGKTNTGAVTIGSNGVPTGVYFFVLQLHIEGRDAIQGRLYLNR